LVGPYNETIEWFHLWGWYAVFLAISQKHPGKQVTFVTGAWGCGVYKNNPTKVFKTLVEVASKFPFITVVYCHYMKENPDLKPCKFVTTVVADMRDVAQKNADKGETVVLHNFANGNQAGGGAANGKSAQEETLCQTLENLFRSLLLLRPYKIPGEKLAEYDKNKPYCVLWSPGCKVPGFLRSFTVVSAAAPNLSVDKHNVLKYPDWSSVKL
jgi:hypothetical protein